MAGHVEGLREICRRRDLAGLILTLKEMIPDYNPSKELLGRALESAAGRRVVGDGGVRLSGCQRSACVSDELALNAWPLVIRDWPHGILGFERERADEGRVAGACGERV